MAKILIPVGSVTGDPPGTQRFMEVDQDDPSTATKTVIFYPKGNNNINCNTLS